MRRRRSIVLLAVAGVAIEAATLRRRTGRLGGDVIVRCGRGHYFTTLWVPGASVKALRFGWWRVQWCPVGRHWALVTPADDAALDDDVRDAATLVHDLRIP